MTTESISLVKYKRLKKALDKGLDHFDYFIDACVFNNKSYWYVNRYYNAFIVYNSSFDSLIGEFDNEFKVNFIANLDNGEVLDEYIKKVYLELRYILMNIMLHTSNILENHEYLKSEYLQLKILSVPVRWLIYLEDRLDIIEKLAEHRDMLFDRYCKNLEEIISVNYKKRPSNFQNKTVEQEPTYTKFTDWLTEDGKRILPSLKKKYQNLKKPGEIASLLFALQQMGLLVTDIALMNQTDLYAKLRVIFGEIGSRQGLNSAIIRYSAANQSQEQDIKDVIVFLKTSLKTN